VESPKERVGDDQRVNAVEQVSRAFQQGYLNVDEFHRYMAQASEARYAEELRAIYNDLPAQFRTSIAVAKKQSERTSIAYRWRPKWKTVTAAIWCISAVLWLIVIAMIIL
jgi:hypothetical protein